MRSASRARRGVCVRRYEARREAAANHVAGGQFFGDRGFEFAGGHGEKTSSGDKVMTRAAEILDWDSAVLVSAMKQAKQEPEEERFASIEPELTALAESGDLS